MTNFFFLQSSSGGPLTMNMIFLLAFLVIFWLFFIRPQKKKADEQKVFEESVKKGEDVVTTSGFIGKVNKVDGQIVQLQLDQKTYVNILASAISKELTEKYRKGLGNGEE